jgi:ParB/RepB/Spo0J family partition protein
MTALNLPSARYEPALPLPMIRPDPDNVRRLGAKDENSDGAVDEPLDSLIASIKHVGILQPIGVRPDLDAEGRYVILYGHRRAEAAASIGLTTVPALVFPNASPGNTATIQLIENTRRADMHWFDVWSAIARASAQGVAIDQLAAALNMPERRVAAIASATKLPPEISAWILKTGNVPTRKALRAMHKLDPQVMLDLWRPLVPKKKADAYPWWKLEQQMRGTAINVSSALFELTPEAKEAIGWHEDLFDPPDHPGYAANRDAFAQLQRQALEASMADLVKKGMTVVRSPDWHGSPPAGCTYETITPAQARKLKKADLPGYLIHASVSPTTGAAGFTVHRRKVRAPTKGGDEAEPEAAATAERPTATHAGMEAIEAAKRASVAECVKGLGEYELVRVLAILLYERVGSQHPQPAWKDADADWPTHHSSGELAASVIRQSTRGYASVQFALVERLGQLLNVPAIWNATRADLDTLKAPMLDHLRRELRVGDYPRQRDLKDALMRTAAPAETLRLNEGLLPLLGYTQQPRLGAPWIMHDDEAPAAANDDDDRVEDDDEEATG